MNRAPKQSRIHQEQPAPYSSDAEQGVLSSIFKSAGKVIPVCIERIEPFYFYVQAHQTIYQNLVDTWEAGGPIDLLTFCERLGEKVLEAVGGRAFLTRLAIDFVPTADNVEYYLDIVRAKYQLRQIIAASTLAASQASAPLADNDGGPEALLDQMEARISSIRTCSLGRNGANIEDAAAEIARPIDTPPDVIDGILHRGGKASIGGASKSRKTWALLDIGISVASGAPWFPGFTTHKGKVLYVNFELPRAFCWKRIRAICDERQITLEPGMLSAWNLRGRVRDWPRLQQQIRPDEFALIIIDPVYKLLLLVGENLRDENRTGGVATALDQMDVLTERTGAAVAFGAHFSKGSQASKESIDRVSGSGVWARDPDAIINFTALEAEDCYAVTMDLRLHPPQKEFSVRWEFPVFIRADELDPAQLKQPNKGAAEKKFTVEQVVIALSDSPPLSATEFTVRIERKLKTSRATAWRLFDEAKEVGAVSCKNKKWRVNKKWKPAAE